MEKLSVVVPCYCEEEALPFFYKEITRMSDVMNYLDFEFLFIDDGSTDRTLEVIKTFASNDSRVRYISFSRNFGKESVIYAGLENATGDYVVIMDADLQDPPSMLEKMYEAIVKEGYDCAATRRVSRAGEPPIRSFFARRFYRLINKMSDIKIVDGARDFRLMKRQVVNAIIKVSEYNRFSKGIFEWVGFKTKWFEYENVARVAGETKWSFWRLFIYSLEGIVAYSTVPLAIATVLGLIFCVLSFLAICFIIIRQLLFHGSAYGWPSLVCIIFLVSGVQLFCIGILGEYLTKTYLETKRRPIYLIRETNKENK